MAKQPQQASHQADASQHPLLQQAIKVDEAMDRLRAAKEDKLFKDEELEQWKGIVIAMAASPNGQLFLKSFVQYSGLFHKSASIRDPNGIVEQKLKLMFYIDWVRPFLSPELRSAIE